MISQAGSERNLPSPAERVLEVVVLNLAVAFVAELFGVAFVGYWAFTLQENPILRVVLAIAAMAALVALWGAAFAPNADSGLTRLQKDVFGRAVLLLTAVALAAAGQRLPALVYAAVVVVNLALVLLLGDELPGERAAGRSVRG